MAGFDREKAKKLVDKNHNPFVLIALGKIGDYEKADPKIVEMDKVKKERKERWYHLI
jgi:hypothetical protein